MSDVATPISARRAQTRARLMAAARTVIAERGAQAASVEEICEAAGFTRGAFYSNFTSKDELCVALLESYRDRAYAAASSAVSELSSALCSADLDELVLAGISAFLLLQGSDREWLLVSAELRLLAAREPSIRRAFRAVDEQGVALFSDLMIPTLAEAGYAFRVPIARALALLEAGFEAAGMRALLTDETFDEDEVRDNLRLILRALIVPIPPRRGQ